MCEYNVHTQNKLELMRELPNWKGNPRLHMQHQRSMRCKYRDTWGRFHDCGPGPTNSFCDLSMKLFSSNNRLRYLGYVEVQVLKEPWKVLLLLKLNFTFQLKCYAVEIFERLSLVNNTSTFSSILFFPGQWKMFRQRQITSSRYGTDTQHT